MKTEYVTWEAQTAAISFPEDLAEPLRFLSDGIAASAGASSHHLTISPDDDGKPGRYSMSTDGVPVSTGRSAGEAVRLLIDELVRCLITDVASGVVIHAGCVSRDGLAILLPGESGAGKSSLTAWLSGHGFDYHSDEAVILLPETPAVTALPRPLVIKDANAGWISKAELRDFAATYAIGQELLAWPASRRPPGERVQGRLCLFPRYDPDSGLRLSPLSPADTALLLTGLNVNARNLADHGFSIVTGFARNVSAFEISYSDFSQLEGVADMLAKLAASQTPPETVHRVFSAIDMSRKPHAGSGKTAFQSRQTTANTTLAPTPMRAVSGSAGPVMTIGMATYDDYDGAYFTIQSLRMYHPEVMDRVEFLVVDNNPRGLCARPLKNLENDIPAYRYVPHESRRTNAVKSVVFEEARGEIVLCVDSHVLVAPGALRQLIDYALTEGDERDFWQGPLVYDDLSYISTHLSPVWSGGMFGSWATDDRGLDPEAAPFEIGMQGMGLFACRRETWPGFNPLFRGFAVEEGYMHEKIRRAGGKTVCLPFLRWMHRFNRPFGIPYENVWEDRVRNYVIAYGELGLDTTELEEHFQALLGPGISTAIRAAKAESEASRGTRR